MEDIWGDSGNGTAAATGDEFGAPVANAFAASGVTDDAAPKRGPSAEAVTPAAAAAPAQGPTLQERARATVEAQLKAIDDRTKQADEASRTKDAATRRKALEFVAQLTSDRDAKIAAVQKAHKQEQDELVKKRAQLKQAGAMWESAVTLVDLAKPNPYSKKGTDRLRSTLLQLREGKVPAAKT